MTTSTSTDPGPRAWCQLVGWPLAVVGSVLALFGITLALTASIMPVRGDVLTAGVGAFGFGVLIAGSGALSFVFGCAALRRRTAGPVVA